MTGWLEVGSASRADFHFDCQKSWFGDDFAPELQYRRDETHIFAFNALYYVNGVKMTTQKLAKTLCFSMFRQQGVVPSSLKHAIVDCWCRSCVRFWVSVRKLVRSPF